MASSLLPLSPTLDQQAPTLDEQVLNPSSDTLCPEVMDWYDSREFRQLLTETQSDSPAAANYLNQLVNKTIDVIVTSSMSTQDKYTEIRTGMIPIFGNDPNFQNEMVAGVLTERLIISYSQRLAHHQAQARAYHQAQARARAYHQVQQSEIPTVPDINDDHYIEYIG